MSRPAISVLGDQSSPEGRAANAIAAIFRNAEGNKGVPLRLTLVIGCQAFTDQSRTRDVDVLFMADFPDKPDRSSSYIAAIEVKSQSASGVRALGGGTLEVRYSSGKWQSASQQAKQAAHSVKSVLKRLLHAEPGFVADLVFLPNVASGELGLSPPHHVLLADASISDFWDCFKASAGDSDGAVSKTVLVRAKEHFARVEHASPLDRRKLEIVTKRIIGDQQYAAKLGQQLLMFRGRGGTGKTIRLLQLGHELRLRAERVLLLTYNKALVADIKRTLSLLGIPSNSSEGSFEVITTDKFLRNLATSPLIGYRVDNNLPYAALQEGMLTAILTTLKGCDEETLALVREEAGDWTFVLVDECQDWTDSERLVILPLFGPGRLILADGYDQFVKAPPKVQWLDRVPTGQRQVVTLRKSLRLKSSLCRLTCEVAQEFGLNDWDLEEQPELGSGRVVVVSAASVPETLPRSLLGSLCAAGNEPIDMLWCVPPTEVHKQDGAKHSSAESILRKCGQEVWNGVDPRCREVPPASEKAVRIVSYDSCRGLEGWTVVLQSFDKWFDHKKYEVRAEADPKRRLAQWLMMPLTRAIDTLVIHVTSPRHPFTEFLHRLSDAKGSNIEWQESH